MRQVPLPNSPERIAQIQSLVHSLHERSPLLIDVWLQIRPDGQLWLQDVRQCHTWPATVQVPGGLLRSSLTQYLAKSTAQALVGTVVADLQKAGSQLDRNALTQASHRAIEALEEALADLPRPRLAEAEGWLQAIPLDFLWPFGESLGEACIRAHLNAQSLGVYLVGSVAEAILFRAEQAGDLRVDLLLDKALQSTPEK